MPRGGKVNKKGRARHFTSPEELERQRREDQRNWRAKKDEASDSEEEEEESGSDNSSSGSESDSESDIKEGAAKTSEIENPNRIVKKVKTVEDVNSEDKPELSRREREEIEKQKARENYQRLHAQGKTDEARADLARLAIIRQQREEAAKKRDEEKKQKEAEKAAKTTFTNKALGKRTENYVTSIFIGIVL